MKYVCSICGYVYDESQEDLTFQQLPESWVCPICKDVYKRQGLKITNTRSLFEHLLSMLAYEYPYLKMDNYVTYE